MVYRIPEAELEYVGGRLEDVVQNGFPEVGWEGDPLLAIGFDRIKKQWVVRDRAMTPPETIMTCPARGLADLNYRELCIKLRNASVKHNGPRTITDRVFARNKAVEDENLRKIHEASAATARDLQELSLGRKTFT